MNTPKPQPLNAPRWSNRTIINAAERLLSQYEEIVGRDHLMRDGLHFDDVYEKLIYPRFQIELYEDDDLGADSEQQKLLGRYDVRANTAHLDLVISRESNDPRRIFTCWHEVGGHGVLQGTWLRKELDRGGQEFIDVTECSLSCDNERILERQANLFAAHLAAPGWLVNHAIQATFRPDRPFPFFEPCKYYLDVDGLPRKPYVETAEELCWWLGSSIARYFGGLSAEAIGYRVAELGWVRDHSVPDLHLRRSARADQRLRGAQRLGVDRDLIIGRR